MRLGKNKVSLLLLLREIHGNIASKVVLANGKVQMSYLLREWCRREWGKKGRGEENVPFYMCEARESQ